MTGRGVATGRGVTTGGPAAPAAAPAMLRERGRSESERGDCNGSGEQVFGFHDEEILRNHLAKLCDHLQVKFRTFTKR
jgi:hypothetical protein